MFSDRVAIFVAAGRGGDGSIAFRREKFVPRGGPAGGDGGAGGDIVLCADPDLRDLTALRYAPHVRADSGRHGEGSNKSGAGGAEAVVAVPVGTQVYGEDGSLVCDLAHPGARVRIARGGRGGQGNRRFATATRQAPRIAGIGEDGEQRALELRLKLLADAALLGFPNVGKSSLLRRLSNATPKVADYPFTTIEPVLGTVEVGDGSQLTVVDVPGLLEGASAGIGLGHEFLAHLERARLLLHVVAADEAAADLGAARAGFATIHNELALHGHGLAERPRIVVLNKLDLLAAADREPLLRAFGARIGSEATSADEQVVRRDGEPVVLGTSCATGEGIDDLIAGLHRHLPERDPTEVAPPEPELADFLVYRPGQAERDRYGLLRDEGGFRVVGPLADALAARLSGVQTEDASRVQAVLATAGVLDALRRAGAREGVEVAVGDERFTYVPDPG